MFTPNAEIIPGYRLVQFFDRGTYGEVWRAEGPGGIPMALKITDLRGALGQKDLRGIQRVKHVQNPYLINIYGIWFLDDHFRLIDENPGSEPTQVAPSWMVVGMNLATGSLRRELNRYPQGIPIDSLLRHMEQAAQGIDHLNRHERIQHGDIKPENLLLSGDVVQIADFGLAKVLGEQKHTMTQMAFTPAYVAPEVIESNQPSAAADQYSLACTYYHLRTGHLPFDEGLPQVSVFKVHQTGQLDLRGIRGTDELRVLRRALALRPQSRFESCVDFVRALRQAVQDDSRALPEDDKSPVRGDERLSTLRPDFDEPVPATLNEVGPAREATPHNRSTAPTHQGDTDPTGPTADEMTRRAEHPDPARSKKTNPLADLPGGSSVPLEFRTAAEQKFPSGDSTDLSAMELTDSRRVRDKREIVPGYVLIKRLGHGNFGTVYRAKGQGVEIAMRVTDIRGRAGRKDLQGILRVRDINHPNLMPITGIWLLNEAYELLDESILESWQSDDSSMRTTIRPEEEEYETGQQPAWLVIGMTLGDQHLEQRLEQCRAANAGAGIPFTELLPLMEDTAKGLDFLNLDARIQHGDIKPENIMMAGGAVQVCDFGLARAIGKMRKRRSDTLYTPAYASPEVIAHQPSPQSDQYSLAITYFHLRTGHFPFADSVTREEVEEIHTRGRLNLRSRCIGWNERKALRKALSRDPARRYGSCKEFVEAIERNHDRDEQGQSKLKSVVALVLLSAMLATLIYYNSPQVVELVKKSTGMQSFEERVAATESIYSDAMNQLGSGEAEKARSTLEKARGTWAEIEQEFPDQSDAVGAARLKQELRLLAYYYRDPADREQLDQARVLARDLSNRFSQDQELILETQLDRELKVIEELYKSNRHRLAISQSKLISLMPQHSASIREAFARWIQKYPSSEVQLGNELTQLEDAFRAVNVDVSLLGRYRTLLQQAEYQSTESQQKIRESYVRAIRQCMTRARSLVADNDHASVVALLEAILAEASRESIRPGENDLADASMMLARSFLARGDWSAVQRTLSQFPNAETLSPAERQQQAALARIAEARANQLALNEASIRELLTQLPALDLPILRREILIMALEMPNSSVLPSEIARGVNSLTSSELADAETLLTTLIPWLEARVLSGELPEMVSLELPASDLRRVQLSALQAVASYLREAYDWPQVSEGLRRIVNHESYDRLSAPLRRLVDAMLIESLMEQDNLSPVQSRELRSARERWRTLQASDAGASAALAQGFQDWLAYVTALQADDASLRLSSSLLDLVDQPVFTASHRQRRLGRWIMESITERSMVAGRDPLKVAMDQEEAQRILKLLRIHERLLSSQSDASDSTPALRRVQVVALSVARPAGWEASAQDLLISVPLRVDRTEDGPLLALKADLSGQLVDYADLMSWARSHLNEEQQDEFGYGPAVEQACQLAANRCTLLDVTIPADREGTIALTEQDRLAVATIYGLAAVMQSQGRLDESKLDYDQLSKQFWTAYRLRASSDMLRTENQVSLFLLGSFWALNKRPDLNPDQRNEGLKYLFDVARRQFDGSNSNLAAIIGRWNCFQAKFQPDVATRIAMLKDAYRDLGLAVVTKEANRWAQPELWRSFCLVELAGLVKEQVIELERPSGGEPLRLEGSRLLQVAIQEAERFILSDADRSEVSAYQSRANAYEDLAFHYEIAPNRNFANAIADHTILIEDPVLSKKASDQPLNYLNRGRCYLRWADYLREQNSLREALLNLDLARSDVEMALGNIACSKYVKARALHVLSDVHLSRYDTIFRQDTVGEVKDLTNATVRMEEAIIATEATPLRWYANELRVYWVYLRLKLDSRQRDLTYQATRKAIEASLESEQPWRIEDLRLLLMPVPYVYADENGKPQGELFTKVVDKFRNRHQTNQELIDQLNWAAVELVFPNVDPSAGELVARLLSSPKLSQPQKERACVVQAHLEWSRLEQTAKAKYKVQSPNLAQMSEFATPETQAVADALQTLQARQLDNLYLERKFIVAAETYVRKLTEVLKSKSSK